MFSPQQPVSPGEQLCRARVAPAARRPRAGRPAWVVALVALGASACEYPTSAPIVETRWAAPIESTRFGVGDLLPGDVTIAPDSSAFIVDFDPVSFGTSLGAICPPCAFANGATVPKPAFSDNFGSTVSFPPEVTSVTILDGSVLVQITNGLNFDPINPGGATGSFSIELRDGADGDLVASAFVDGATTPFPPGTTLDVVLPFQPVVLDGALEADIAVDSPLGDPITIDSSLSISVTATVDQVRVSEVAIDVSAESVTLDPVSLDLDEIGEEIQDRVESGALVLDVVNPFGVGADFQISVDGPTMATLQKSVSVTGAATEELRIEFTQDEIRSVLGETSVSLTGGSTVDPAARIVRVQPGEELVLDALLDFVVRVGG